MPKSSFEEVWRPSVFAVALVTAAAALRLWPLQDIGVRLAWLTFYPAVMVVAMYGGFLAGVVGTILSCLTVLFLLPIFVHQLYIKDYADYLGMAVFFITCMMISGVAEAMHRARAREKRANEKLETVNRGLKEEVLHRQAAEAEARVLNEQLEQRVAERTAELVRANENLQAEMAERERAEEEIRRAEIRYRTTLDRMLEGCQIIGYDWRYLYVNDVAAAQGRSTKEALLGRTMMEMYPGIEKTDMFARLERCMQDRVPQKVENEFVFADGTAGWFNLSLEPVSEGTFILSADITKEKLLAEELRKNHERLEELVQERTAQLEAANKELEAFSYSVSHDLRAPLRHIDGFVELLQKSAESLLDPKSRRYLQTISSSAKEMGTLIDELLVFSRMSRAEMSKTTVKMEPMVADVIRSLEQATHKRAIDWSVERLPEVEADPSMLRLVLVNLLSNAIKYTGTRERGKIHIGHVARDGESVFLVRDNGVGFDMRFADKLFGVFQRLHRSEDFEGVGIGLANVRRIIQRHGGRTWAEGAINEGATFYFSIPIIAKG